MDARLVAWARAVKARRRPRLPVLWLFTDAARLPDPLPSIARLPRRISGVVFRHDGVPGRAALAKRVAALCRARGIRLAIAGDWRLAAALHAGLHVRAAQGRQPRHPPSFLTYSCHDRAEAARARRAGADIVFLSPAFATESHTQVHPLGSRAWMALAMNVSGQAVALGGVTGLTARALTHHRCQGAGAIGALSKTGGDVTRRLLCQDAPPVFHLLASLGAQPPTG